MRHFITTALAITTILGAAHGARAEMTLTSTDITDGHTLPTAQVFNNFGCTGDNISPQLSWSGVPETAKSLALTVYDPDAPTGSGWWHWVVFNLPVSTTTLPAGASSKGLPEGTVQSLTDYGFTGFGGACPPAGDKPHRYIVTLHALDTDALPLDEKASGAMVGYYLGMHGIEKASITATYARPSQ